MRAEFVERNLPIIQEELARARKRRRNLKRRIEEARKENKPERMMIFEERYRAQQTFVWDLTYLLEDLLEEKARWDLLN